MSIKLDSIKQILKAVTKRNNSTTLDKYCILIMDCLGHSTHRGVGFGRKVQAQRRGGVAKIYTQETAKDKSSHSRRLDKSSTGRQNLHTHSE